MIASFARPLSDLMMPLADIAPETPFDGSSGVVTIGVGLLLAGGITAFLMSRRGDG